jgi:hypothetical protein
MLHKYIYVSSSFAYVRYYIIKTLRAIKFSKDREPTISPTEQIKLR